MKIIRKNYIIETPDNFEKVPLPYFDEWLADLKTNPKQGRGQLRTYRGDCCLGRLSFVQGRLTEFHMGTWYDGAGEGRKSFICLSKDNPCSSIFGTSGMFPDGCFVHKEEYFADCFYNLNDSLKLTMLEIADVLETLFCPVK